MRARRYRAPALCHWKPRRHSCGRRHPLLAQPPGAAWQHAALCVWGGGAWAVHHCMQDPPTLVCCIPFNAVCLPSPNHAKNNLCLAAPCCQPPDPPILQAALAEISRVLRPGGVLVGSTFMSPLAPLGEVLGDDNVRPLVQVRWGSYAGVWGLLGVRTWVSLSMHTVCLGTVGRVPHPTWGGGGGGGVRRASQAHALPLAPHSHASAAAHCRAAQGLNPFSSRSNMYRSWEEAELKELCETVGLTGFARNRSRQFIMWSATKPGSSSVLESSMPA